VAPLYEIAPQMLTFNRALAVCGMVSGRELFFLKWYRGTSNTLTVDSSANKYSVKLLFALFLHHLYLIALSASLNFGEPRVLL